MRMAVVSVLEEGLGTYGVFASYEEKEKENIKEKGMVRKGRGLNGFNHPCSRV